MPLLDRLRAAVSGSFARAVGVLVGGTALGHAVTALALPVLSRLYSPAEFGLLAAFSSIVSIIAVAACMRYEIAIALPEDDNEAARLTLVAVVASTVIGTMTAIPAVLAPAWLAAALGQPGLEGYLWMFPLCVFLAGTFAALQYWNLRLRSYQTLAATRVVQSAAASGSQLALGVASAGPAGLMAGPVFNSLAGTLMLVANSMRRNARSPIPVGAKWGLWQCALRHFRFPIFSAPEALANAASIHLPVLMIAAMAGPGEAGHLMLAMVVVQAPMALLGNAVGQVYLSRAAEELREGRLAAFTADVFGGLARNAAGPLLFLGIVAPFAFVPVFGEAWSRGGVIVAWLTPWFVLNLLTAPVSLALHIAGRQRLALLLQFAGLGLRTAAVWGAEVFLRTGHTEAYALSGSVFYALYLAAVLWVVGCTPAQAFGALTQAVPRCAGWIGAGALVASALALAG
jgi:O-antigen/teichoic acid export membrane protein